MKHLLIPMLVVALALSSCSTPRMATDIERDGGQVERQIEVTASGMWDYEVYGSSVLKEGWLMLSERENSTMQEANGSVSARIQSLEYEDGALRFTAVAQIPFRLRIAVTATVKEDTFTGKATVTRIRPGSDIDNREEIVHIEGRRRPDGQFRASDLQLRAIDS